MEHGVSFDNSSINFIFKNNVAANGGCGFILLFSSSKNSLIGNVVSNNKYGIYLASSSHNNIITILSILSIALGKPTAEI